MFILLLHVPYYACLRSLDGAFARIDSMHCCGSQSLIIAFVHCIALFFSRAKVCISCIVNRAIDILSVSIKIMSCSFGPFADFIFIFNLRRGDTWENNFCVLSHIRTKCRILRIIRSLKIGENYGPKLL